MKRKKTRPPQAGSGEIREVWEEIRQPPSGASRYQAAEAARAVYDKAWGLHRRFPQDAEASNAYIEAQGRYRQLISEAYPPTFNQDLVRLEEGDPSGLESVVSFLEADPIFYGTGYLKEALSRLLRDVELPTNYIQRLQVVVLSLVDRRDGREFRAYCRLARKVDSPELRKQLMWRLTRVQPSSAALTPDQPSLLKEIEQDKNIRRRAKWMLEALGQKMEPRVETRG